MKPYFFSIILFLISCNTSNTDKDSATLIIGLEGDYAPYNWTILDHNEDSVAFTDHSGYATGYDVMMAKRIAQALDMQLEIKKISWDGLILALQHKHIDAIIAGMSPTPQRRQAVLFSDPYYQDSPELAIVVRKEGVYATARTRSDFTGATLTAQQGTYHATLLEQIPNLKRSALLGDYMALMQALTAGVIDGYLAEFVVAQEHVRSHDHFTLIRLMGEEALVLDADHGTLAIAVSKDAVVLQEKINQVLAGISEEERQMMMHRASMLASTL